MFKLHIHVFRSKSIYGPYAGFRNGVQGTRVSVCRCGVEKIERDWVRHGDDTPFHHPRY